LASCNGSSLVHGNPEEKSTSSECLIISINKFDSVGFSYLIINKCSNEVFVPKDFESYLKFEEDKNFQNPKISFKKIYPLIIWKNNKEKDQYFSSIEDCGRKVDSLVPYYKLKKDSAITFNFNFREMNFQNLKENKKYQGTLTLIFPDEYREVCPKFYSGKAVTSFEWH